MKIEKLDYNKLKVTLTADDLLQLDLNFARAADDAESIKQAFIRLMKIAQRETGFDVRDARLMIEAVPANDDGFILFVTRIDQMRENIGASIRPARKKPVLKAKAPSPQPGSAVLFRFSEFEQLIDFATRTKAAFCDFSTLYELNGSYYLALLKNPLQDTFSANCIEASEFGARLFRNNINEVYLEEHGKRLICNNAVETIRSYFGE